MFVYIDQDNYIFFENMGVGFKVSIRLNVLELKFKGIIREVDFSFYCVCFCVFQYNIVDLYFL